MTAVKDNSLVASALAVRSPLAFRQGAISAPLLALERLALVVLLPSRLFIYPIRTRRPTSLLLPRQPFPESRGLRWQSISVLRQDNRLSVLAEAPKAL